MMTVTLKRTFHPVGQGAFFSERFLDENNFCVFSAIYDCGGGFGFNINDYIDDCINQKTIFNKNNRINAIFISHFHNDHVNGLVKLLDYCDNLFLPVLTPNEVAETILHNVLIGKDSDNRTNKLFDSLYKQDSKYYDGKVFFIAKAGSDSGDYDGDKRDNSPQKYEHIERKIEDESNLTMQYDVVDGNIIPSGYPITIVYNEVPDYHKWIYLPFNFSTNIPNGELKKKLSALNLLDVDGEIILEALKNEIESNGIENIQSIYEKVISKNMNHHSMTVYSGYKTPCEHCHCHCCCHYCFDRKRCLCDEYRYYRCNQPNCLFTGDFEFTHEHVDKMITFYKKYWNCSKTIQVPHHGSESIGHKNYGYVAYSSCCKAVITTNSNKKNVTSANVIIGLAEHKVAPIFVTENPESKYKQVYNIY